MLLPHFLYIPTYFDVHMSHRQGERKRNAGALLNTMDSIALQQARNGNLSRTAMDNVGKKQLTF